MCALSHVEGKALAFNVRSLRVAFPVFALALSWRNAFYYETGRLLAMVVPTHIVFMSFLKIFVINGGKFLKYKVVNMKFSVI